MAELKTDENTETEDTDDRRIDLHAVETPLPRVVGNNQSLHLERDSRSLENQSKFEDQ